MNAEADHDEDEKVVRSVVESYTKAVTARDEATAARFTCRKTPGLLWVGAVVRPIKVLSIAIVVDPLDKSLLARVLIQVRGEPESPLMLRKIHGAWCVWP